MDVRTDELLDGTMMLQKVAIGDISTSRVRVKGPDERGYRRDTHKRRKREPLVGKRFGAWVVVSEFSGRYVDCRCDCGVERPVQITALRCGHSKCCGHTRGKKKSPRTQEHNARISDGMRRYHKQRRGSQ